MDVSERIISSNRQAGNEVRDFWNKTVASETPEDNAARNRRKNTKLRQGLKQSGKGVVFAWSCNGIQAILIRNDRRLRIVSVIVNAGCIITAVFK